MRSKSSRNRTAAKPQPPPPLKSGGDYSSVAQQEHNCYEGERLTSFLESMEREIESASKSEGGAIPEKLWLKQQFSIGVNEVTRVLERMPPIISDTECDKVSPSSAKLQAIILASDSNPRWLTKHIVVGLAASRGVPIIFVKDKKRTASLRLGQLLKIKTAMAVGIKARGNGINQFLDKIIPGNDNQFCLEA